ncbi:MAG: hypothetical protein ACUVXB_11600 [Bryobacteraceae bacterium]
MQTTTKIESLSYATIYVLGCIVAGVLSLSQNTALPRLAVHIACSWGYVVYYVLKLS